MPQVDVQNLSLTMCVNCANQGIVPVRFKMMPDAVVSVDKDTFAMSNLWELHDRVLVERTAVTPMHSTTYPGLRLTGLVVRKPTYFCESRPRRGLNSRDGPNAFSRRMSARSPDGVLLCLDVLWQSST
jgi:hypothetical protein